SVDVIEPGQRFNLEASRVHAVRLGCGYRSVHEGLVCSPPLVGLLTPAATSSHAAYTRAVPACAANQRYDFVKCKLTQTLAPERVIASPSSPNCPPRKAWCSHQNDSRWPSPHWSQNR